MRILKLIIDGFHDVNYIFNLHMSLISRLKIAITPEIEDHLFHEYFKKRVERILGMMDVDARAAAATATGSGVKKFEIRARSKNTMKKVDLMRIQNMNTTFGGSGDTFDHHIIQTIESIVETKNTTTGGGVATGPNEWMKHYYTLKLMLHKSVVGVNSHIIDFANYIIELFKDHVQIIGFIRNAYRFIEQNDAVFKYADFQLYDHQKQLFTIAKRPQAKLILYIAPTGTGKTLSPLGLSEKYKIIFVCAARHVGFGVGKGDDFDEETHRIRIRL